MTAASTRPAMLDLRELERLVGAHLPMVRAILVSRGGRMVYERRFDETPLARRVDIYSCTKSVLSMLVGALTKKGDFPDLGERVLDVLPGLARHAHPSARNILVRHCFDMTLGYDLHMGDYDVASALARPLDREPGTWFGYNDVGPHIVSQIVTARTGQPASRMADALLFSKLGFTGAPWPEDGDGCSVGGYGLRLTPREMLAFGELALRRGEIKGERLVDEAFFAASISPRQSGGFPGHNPYGLFWWVSARGGLLTHYALGYGGQLICVCPDLDLVAVVTCTHELGPDVVPAQDLYFEHILPAAMRQGA